MRSDPPGLLTQELEACSRSGCSLVRGDRRPTGQWAPWRLVADAARKVDVATQVEKVDDAVGAPVPGGEADQDAATTPVEIVGEAPVYVSRLLSDRSDARTLDLWIVADNLHRGQALTAVEIAETLLRDHLTPRLGTTPEA